MTKRRKKKISNVKSNEYDVGYKKPPKKTQFQPGQSGNPKGRPKRSKNMNTLFNIELDKMVTVNEQGKRYEISKREAVVKRMVNEAASGNINAVRTLMSVLGTDPEVDPKDLIGDHDVGALERFAEKVLRGSKNEN